MSQEPRNWATSSIVVRHSYPWWMPPWLAVCALVTSVAATFFIVRYIVPRQDTDEVHTDASALVEMHKQTLQAVEKVAEISSTQKIVVEYPPAPQGLLEEQTEADPFGETVRDQTQDSVTVFEAPEPEPEPQQRATVAEVLTEATDDGKVQTVILGTLPKDRIVYDDALGKVTSINLGTPRENASLIRSWFTFSEADGNSQIIIDVDGKQYWSLKKHILRYQNGGEDYLLIPFDREDPDPTTFIEVYPPFTFSVVQAIEN